MGSPNVVSSTFERISSINFLLVCLMSQSWDNVANMHDHLLIVQNIYRDIVHAQTVSCLGKLVISTVCMRRWKRLHPMDKLVMNFKSK